MKAKNGFTESTPLISKQECHGTEHPFCLPYEVGSLIQELYITPTCEAGKHVKTF